MRTYEPRFEVGVAGYGDEVVVSEDGAYATLPPSGWTATEYADFLNAIASSALGAELRRIADDLVEAGFGIAELGCE